MSERFEDSVHRGFLVDEPLAEQDLDWLLRIGDEITGRVREAGLTDEWLNCYPGAASRADGPEVVGVPVPMLRSLVAEVRRLRDITERWKWGLKTALREDANPHAVHMVAADIVDNDGGMIPTLPEPCPRSSHQAHADPDNSGQCIYCGSALLPDTLR